MSPENITHGWGERAVAYLRRVHPHGTARHVAHDLNVSVRTAEKWMDGSVSMSADALLRALAVYGPPLLSAVFPGLVWVETLLALGDAAALETHIVAVSARAEQTRAMLRGRS